MKKTVALVVVASFILASCGANPTSGSMPQAYGPLNEVTHKSKDACYEISTSSIILGIVLIETIIAPIYFFGYSLYVPVRLKKHPDDQCTADD